MGRKQAGDEDHDVMPISLITVPLLEPHLCTHLYPGLKLATLPKLENGMFSLITVD